MPSPLLGPSPARRTWLLVLGLTAATLTVTSTAASAVDGDPGAPSPCTRPAATGDIDVAVEFAGTTYSVLAHVPEGLGRTQRAPLVLNLHGSSSNGPQQMDISGLRAVAAQEGFVVAAPSAAIPLAPQNPPDPDGSWAWNVPGVPTTAGAFPPADARDDVRFLTQVVEVLSADLCTDPSRTYATGYSGGGRMSSALACRAADRIAAIAPVAGLRAGRPDPDDVSVPEIEDCQPSRPVPVVTFHGQQDFVNPYPGNPDLRWGYSVPVAAATWARLDDCRVGPQASTVSEHVTRLTYRACARGAEVVLYRVSNGGHTWPGTTVPAPGLGLVTQEIDAARIMWEFFEQHRLPTRAVHALSALDALLTRYNSDDTISNRTTANLRDRLDRAVAASERGSEQAALAHLQQFVDRARNQVKGDAADLAARQALVVAANLALQELQVSDDAEDG